MRFDVGGYGGYQAIKVEMHNGQRVYVGASESRKDGRPQLTNCLALCHTPNQMDGRLKQSPIQLLVL